MQKQAEDRVWYSLYGRLLDERVLKKAYTKVRAANGVPGIDGQSVTSFGQQLDRNLSELVCELKGKRYRPQAVKRVEIPKPNGGVCKLGIPTVRDRVVQQALLDLLNPIFDPHFHPSSYGYRPGRSCHHAITKAALFMRKYDLRWVVDMDLSKCFDTLQHDFLLKQVRKRVADGSILNLISLFLGSGVIVDGERIPTEEGSPQGGVISPLLANIYLDYFDQTMKAKGYRIVRYADDILIFARSRRGAERRLKVAEELLENEMGLKVNREKTKVTTLWKGVNYLGVTIDFRFILIQAEKIKDFKRRVKKMTIRTQPVNLAKIIGDLNSLLRGYANYFRIANCTGVFHNLMSWIRRRLRAIQLAQWKKPAKLHRRLRQLGYQVDFKKIKMASWRSSNSPLASMALPNKFFRELGLFEMDRVKTGHSVLVG